ncbi:TolC family protein [Actimicrobium antarcticum]|uniref:TolC family outer membrane protein n=1 Tax=Actimicrobium antarcticum TaxID=1051899 RepID=A0ABP7SZ94_9BURK
MNFSVSMLLAGLPLLLFFTASQAQYSGDAVPPIQPDRSLRLGALGALLELPNVLPLGPVARNARSVVPAGQLAPNLQEIASASLDHSLEVEAARQRVASFGFIRDAARGALLPRADVRMSDGRGRLTSVEPAVILPRREVTVTLRQALIDEPARNEMQRQRKLVASSEEQLANAISTTLLESSNAFLAAMQASIAVRLGAEYETMLAELLRYIGERADAGGTSKADLQRVRARVANARTLQTDAGANLQVAVRNLARLTGAAPTAIQLGLISPGFALPANALLASDLAARQNHELLAALIEAEAVQSERDGQRARFIPRMDLEVSHTRAVNAAGLDALTRDTKAMVIMNISLLNGGSDLAQMRAAGARMLESGAKAGNVERKLVQEIDTAYANLDAADQRFRSVRDELDANTTVVAAFRAQMVGSNRPLLDVLDAYQRLHQSRLDLMQVLVSETQNQLRVAHLTGTLAQLLVPTPVANSTPIQP